MASALAGTLVSLLVAVVAARPFFWSGTRLPADQLGLTLPWLPQLGPNLRARGRLDRGSWLIVLTALLGPLCVLGVVDGDPVKHQRTFYVPGC